jgi:hypothetical protein
MSREAADPRAGVREFSFARAGWLTVHAATVGRGAEVVRRRGGRERRGA